jgi:DNA-binding response OmpR family regulator
MAAWRRGAAYEPVRVPSGPASVHWGEYPFQVMKSEYTMSLSADSVKSTRSHSCPASIQSVIWYPEAGVAETKFTVSPSNWATTTPPTMLNRRTCPPVEDVATSGGGAGSRVTGSVGGPAVGLGAGAEVRTGAGGVVGSGCAVASPAPPAVGPPTTTEPPAPLGSTGVSSCGNDSACAPTTESIPNQATVTALAVTASQTASMIGPLAREAPATCSLTPANPIGSQLMANVLLVEDDPEVRSAVIRQLTVFGHAVRSAGTALSALREANRDPGDIIILDLGLPDLDGSETLKMLRAITQVPVIIATARDEEAEIIRLLNAGADDYLIKPFSGAHLAARITALLRRTGADQPQSALQVGDLVIDPRRREAHLEGRALDLSRREFDLLAYLAARPGEVVTRRELLTQVWQLPYGDDQTIDVHLSWLRRKLGERASAPRYLHTVRGVGVRLSEPRT